MLKIARIVMCIIFVAVTAVFGYFYVNEQIHTDKTVPVITVESELLEVPLGADNSELLKGVSAYDEKDGDLSDKVIVESLSNFIGDGICKATYAVCDSDNHVATASRRIRYAGYHAPRFSLSRSVCFSVYETVDVSAAVTANDCIDGDITKNIVLTSDDYSGATTGVFSVKASVNNSKGDSSLVTLPLIIEDRSLSAPSITLSSYLVYTGVNEPVDIDSYLVSAADSASNDLKSSVRTENNADYSKAGVYTAHYYATDKSGNTGHTVLVIIVEG